MTDNRNFDDVVIYGAGSMALETACYINDVNSNYIQNNNAIRVTDIVSSSFDRLNEIEEVLCQKVERHHDPSTVINIQKKYAIVAIADPQAKEAINRIITGLNCQYLSIIHPTAYVSPLARIGSGVIIGPFSYLAPCSEVSDNCILNVRVTLGHDAVIGPGSIVSPHVDINGFAQVGRYSFLGANVTVDPKVKIGDYCVVSSGLTLKKNAPSGHLVFVNEPIRKLKMFDDATGKKLFDKS